MNNCRIDLGKRSSVGTSTSNALPIPSLQTFQITNVSKEPFNKLHSRAGTARCATTLHSRSNIGITPSGNPATNRDWAWMPMYAYDLIQLSVSYTQRFLGVYRCVLFFTRAAAVNNSATILLFTQPTTTSSNCYRRYRHTRCPVLPDARTLYLAEAASPRWQHVLHRLAGLGRCFSNVRWLPYLYSQHNPFFTLHSSCTPLLLHCFFLLCSCCTHLLGFFTPPPPPTTHDDSPLHPLARSLRLKLVLLLLLLLLPRLISARHTRKISLTFPC